MQSNRKAILQLLADGQFHSGQEIGDQLSITRSAVWKAIQMHLSDLALPFESVKGKGYRIPGGIEFLDKANILNAVSNDNVPFCPAITLLDEVDSTNSYLLNIAKTQPSKSQLCLAEAQTQGHGRRGRRWYTGFARNIALSGLWCFPQGAHQVTGLSLVVGLAVVNALKRLGLDHIQLKWPNDIMWQYRKLAGIAVEIHIDNLGVCYAVMGIGLNVQLPKRDLSANRVCLHDIMQMACSRNQVAGLIIDELISHLRVFEKTGLSPFKDEWQGYNCLRDEQIDVHTLQGVTAGIMRGIDEQGGLLLETEQGIDTFHMGEICIRARNWPKK